MGVQIPSDADGFKQMLEAVSTPAELRELLHADGVDDKVVAEFVRAAGVDDVLDRIFGLMGGRFVPEKAGDGAGSVQWNVKTPDGPRTYTSTSPAAARPAAAAPRPSPPSPSASP